MQGLVQYRYVPSRRPVIQPLRLSALRSRVSRRHIRAAPGEGSNNAAPVLDTKKIGVIPFTQDTESFQQVMAFDGPAPEVQPYNFN
ncbi:hypothetical protein WJX75_003581 [Coccomyxa subellipsoidea]|uniref:Uncharacterized protein n=1 Tax=Coccomyxa subellipsoidea TaxID=248742 RepID=A0ABR2YCW7_9CHLO